MEVVRETRDVERNCQEGVVIRPNWVYNNTFGVRINELGTSEGKPKTAVILLQKDKKK